MKVQIYITLKPSVLDPQGKVVMQTLHNLGYDNVKDTRVSKFIELELAAENKEQAEKEVEEICKKVLANPNTETYYYEFKN